jgi:hypothetical protein
MNKNILKKCLEELVKKEFSKDYVRGMLETLYEMDNTSLNVESTHFTKALIQPTIEENKIYANKEITEEIPAFLRTGPIGNINGSGGTR